MSRSSAFLAAAMIVAPVVLSAQQLRGLVRDAGTNVPLAGAVVTAVDSAGVQSARAIADARGRFAIALPAHPARLHLIRIGYRPRDVDVPSRWDVVLEVSMDKIPPLLETVRVSGRELCPGSTERGAAFALWEEARAGLLAAVVARELKPAQARTLAFERGVSPGDELVRHQRTQMKTGSTTRPFMASAGASYFAKMGYMNDAGDGSRIYNAPDADVLLDPSFAATHCFRLQRANDAAHVGQVGLAFNPAPGRDTIVDVTGVIWLDDLTPQLRSFDFLYTSLEPPAMKMNAGGHLEFRMANGVAFIERWILRLPIMSVVTTANVYRPNRSGPVRRQDRDDLRLSEIAEAGGIVLDAAWGDGEEWHAPRTVLAGSVAQRKTGRPVRNAIITLQGTSDSTATDSAGAFRLEVLPGRYNLIAVDTLLREFVPERLDRRVVVAERDRVTNVRVEVEQVTNVLADACNGQAMKEGTSIITGRIVTAAGVLPGDARVRARWQADYNLAGARGAGITIDEKVQDAPVDDRGRFVLCGIARERPIQMRLTLGGASFADTVVTVYSDRLTYAVEWHVPPVVNQDRR